jgi:hypothetical protein
MTLIGLEKGGDFDSRWHLNFRLILSFTKEAREDGTVLPPAGGRTVAQKRSRLDAAADFTKTLPGGGPTFVNA